MKQSYKVNEEGVNPEGETVKAREMDLYQVQRSMLELIACGKPMQELLDQLCLLIEGYVPGGMCSVLLLDHKRKAFQGGAGPSLPESYAKVFEGLHIGNYTGSCGTAAYLGKQVIVSEIATDPLWETMRNVALKNGVQACWSTPFFDKAQQTIGTFAISLGQPCHPTSYHQSLIKVAVQLAMVIVEREQIEDKLSQIVKGLSATVGETFFRTLVEHLNLSLNVDYAFIGQLFNEPVKRIETIAAYGNGEFIENFSYSLTNIPCNEVINHGLTVYPKGIQQLFKGDPILEKLQVEGYAGTPLVSAAGHPIGLLVVLHRQPLQNTGLIESTLKLFAARASSELERKRAEEALRTAYDGLEREVQSRTTELSQVNTNLQKEIFERQRTEVKLWEAKEVAESANRAKSEFLAQMSHELRTPLNAILGFTQLLRKQEDLSSHHQKDLATIEQSGNHLLGLINEVLDLAKIETRTVEICPEKCDLHRLLQTITDIMSARAQAKGLSFKREWPSEIPDAVLVDEKKLQQILMNLLDNAIKYTDKGGVKFKVSYDETRLRFQVEDTGIGIPSQHLVAIFDKFHQVRDQHTSVDGVGLGLAISKKLVTLMGGVLEVTSKPGQGSVFWFDLDLPHLPEMTCGGDLTKRNIIGLRGTKRKILIVDDRDDNRQLLRNMLSPLGFELRDAKDGQDCIVQAMGMRPDLILMDLRMPVLDGFEATRQIREMENIRHVVIIAISASVFEHHKQECLNAGADGFLAKPFSQEILLHLLCEHLELEVVYEKESGKQETIENLQGPAQKVYLPLPSEELTKMKDLAMRGDIDTLLERINRLEQIDSQHALLVSELRALANNFQMKKIRQLLQSTGPSQ